MNKLVERMAAEDMLTSHMGLTAAGVKVAPKSFVA
eukprot:CAMPEP_0174890510 /NCGR_PEP_ID=MMETSP0167-20121228/5661_1 /TAXON_ID=38298 /ORGANISM="Rhodella maculata, Strain CCMP736" /LENGTH=34 /DNA_ID= /DNA_START= /DNA_END= /DNA_ORIENTATION=